MSNEIQAASNNQSQVSRIDSFKKVLNSPSIQEQFRNALADSAPLFVASMIDIYTNDKNLQQCAPGAVIMEALKAATLKLPINKNLGFAYIVAYKGKPEFQIGYRGLVQLAIRAGQYRFLNAGPVYEGQTCTSDWLTGEVSIQGEPSSENVIGYFAHIQLLNGFSKTIYWTKERVLAHARRFSKSFASPASPWQTHFDGMATKTMLRNLLSKYGILSVEMIQALSSDTDERSPDIQAEMEIARFANNGDEVDIEESIPVLAAEPSNEVSPSAEGPGF